MNDVLMVLDCDELLLSSANTYSYHKITTIIHERTNATGEPAWNYKTCSSKP